MSASTGVVYACGSISSCPDINHESWTSRNHIIHARRPSFRVPLRSHHHLRRDDDLAYQQRRAVRNVDHECRTRCDFLILTKSYGGNTRSGVIGVVSGEGLDSFQREGRGLSEVGDVLVSVVYSILFSCPLRRSKRCDFRDRLGVPRGQG